MLWLLLAVALPSQEVLPPTTIASIAELDRACATANEETTFVTLALSGYEIPIASESEYQSGLRRALPALDGQVLVHWIERPELEWRGSTPHEHALEALSNGDAVAWVGGRLAQEDSFPVCFGHPQVASRSVAMEIDELVVSDRSGVQLGRLRPKSKVRRHQTGGAARVAIECGRTCPIAPRVIDIIGKQLQDKLSACADGAPAGQLVYELAAKSQAQSLKINAAISSLPDAIDSCARDVIRDSQLPQAQTAGEILIIIDVPRVRSSSKPLSKKL